MNATSWAELKRKRLDAMTEDERVEYQRALTPRLVWRRR